MDTNPFWVGFFHELEKSGQEPLGVATQVATSHPLATAAAVGVPLGLGAVAIRRALKRRAAAKAGPAAAAATKGIGKGKALVYGAGLLGTGYVAGKLLGRSASKE